ncbi:MAG TPA: LytTR family DNA-binding domain-containing protein [Phnomibacter sp.]|nr:LytTR family DNA-binding domain-containing protein [Phnomibacter sp.]
MHPNFSLQIAPPPGFFNLIPCSEKLTEANYPALLELRHQLGLLRIALADILYIEGSSNYSRIYLTRGHPVVTARVLRWFQEVLPGHLFIRVHRSHIVNWQHVASTCLQSASIYLTSGEKLIISRRRKALLYGGTSYTRHTDKAAPASPPYYSR